MQSKKGSFIEAIVGTATGLVVTLLFSLLIYWACKVKIDNSQIGLVTFYFTVLSIARSYIVRRFFNKTIIKDTKTKHDKS